MKRGMVLHISVLFLIGQLVLLSSNGEHLLSGLAFPLQTVEAESNVPVTHTFLCAILPESVWTSGRPHKWLDPGVYLRLQRNDAQQVLVEERGSNHDSSCMPAPWSSDMLHLRLPVRRPFSQRQA